MKHIMHVVESFAAGTLSVVQAMCNRQVEDGHRVTLCYSLRVETPADWRSHIDARVECLPLPMRRRPAPLSDLAALWRLTGFVRRLQPDIVHLHSSKAGAIGRLASLMLPRPRWYFSPHGLSFLQSAQPGHVHRGFLLLETLLRVPRVTYIACSVSEAALIEKHLQRSAHVVNNGIDVSAVPVRGQDGMPLRVGTVGRVSLARNPELFARIARRMRRADLHFVWIGGGAAADEEQLRAAGVELSGWLDRPAAMALLATLDIYVQPSLWEGMPIAVLEAMACGLPVVASDVVGNRDLVRQGLNGMLADSEQAFVNAIEHLAAVPMLRHRLGEVARAEVHAHYSLDQMMLRLYQAYGI